MKRLLLAILSGLLLSFSWPHVGYYGLIFIAFVPLLILESTISRDARHRSLKVFGYSFLSFFIFNVIVDLARNSLPEQIEFYLLRKNQTGGSVWESNPLAIRFTCRPTVLKTAATTRCANTSSVFFITL